MAITNVVRTGRRPSTEDGLDGTVPLRFRVFSNSAQDGSPRVLADLRLPRYGDSLARWESWPTAGNFRCVKRTAVDIAESPLIFDVECLFSTKFSERDDKDVTPLDRRPHIVSRQHKIPVPWLTRHEAARLGELITNTAGDPYSPPLTTHVRQTHYSVQFTASNDEPWFHEVTDLINEKPLLIRGYEWPKETVLIDDIELGEWKWHQNQEYYPVTMTLIGDRRGHKRRELVRGTRELFNGKRRACRDEDGNPVTVPVPLDEDGRQIPFATLRTDPIDSPFFDYIQEFEAYDFDTLFPAMGL
jgi:hypothetical protein